MPRSRPSSTAGGSALRSAPPPCWHGATPSRPSAAMRPAAVPAAALGLLGDPGPGPAHDAASRMPAARGGVVGDLLASLALVFLVSCRHRRSSMPASSGSCWPGRRPARGVRRPSASRTCSDDADGAARRRCDGCRLVDARPLDGRLERAALALGLAVLRVLAAIRRATRKRMRPASRNPGDPGRARLRRARDPARRPCRRVWRRAHLSKASSRCCAPAAPARRRAIADMAAQERDTSTLRPAAGRAPRAADRAAAALASSPASRWAPRTALLGEKAAMACTVAVEEVIDEHYAEPGRRARRRRARAQRP